MVDRDDGAVTVEAAIGISGLIVVLTIALAGIAAVTDQLRCTDAAREAARLVARGEADQAEAAAARIAPGGAVVRVSRDGENIAVEVSAGVIGGLLPGVQVRGSAFAVAEPGVESGVGP